MIPYTMAELRECAERELKMRRHVYPNRVLTGRMSQQKANLEVAMMAAIVAHFAMLEEQERLL